MALIDVVQSVDEVKRLAECEREIKEALEKYGCDLTVIQAFENGQMVQQIFGVKARK